MYYNRAIANVGFNGTGRPAYNKGQPSPLRGVPNPGVSAARLGKPSPVKGKKNPKNSVHMKGSVGTFNGKTHSDSTKKLMSDAKKGIPRTEASIQSFKNTWAKKTPEEIAESVKKHNDTIAAKPLEERLADNKRKSDALKGRPAHNKGIPANKEGLQKTQATRAKKRADAALLGLTYGLRKLGTEEEEIQRAIRRQETKKQKLDFLIFCLALKIHLKEISQECIDNLNILYEIENKPLSASETIRMEKYYATQVRNRLQKELLLTYCLALKIHFKEI